MKDWKYIIAYIIPLAAFWGIHQSRWLSFGSVYVSFVFIPLLELILPTNITNHKEAEEEERSSNRFFDALLYSHVPILYALVFYALYYFQTHTLTTLETVGMIFNVGVLVGGFGINIGHELGHRNKIFEQNLSKLLLLPALYQHFFIEHNRGHHKNVATDLDPASSRLGENLYAFWWRSVTDSYVSAWHIENEQMKREGKAVMSWSNGMIRFHVYQTAYLVAIGLVFGGPSVLMAIAFAIFGFLLLETVNYIEHYGLRRKQLANGRFEPVMPHHSWNSDHELGRIVLFELTRHSDHHYKATRPYQILRHFDESPQLPFGYPLSMIASLVPPLWFSLMDNRVPREENSTDSVAILAA
jgi:alkane 1-monooxygenase